MKFENISVLKKNENNDTELLEDLCDERQAVKVSKDISEDYYNKVHDITKNNYWIISRLSYFSNLDLYYSVNCN